METQLRRLRLPKSAWAVLLPALPLLACNPSSDPLPPAPLPAGVSSADLVAALDQIAPYVLEHELLTRTGASDLTGDGRGATASAPGGGILISTGLGEDGGLADFDFGDDGQPDSTTFRLLLTVPPGAQTLVMTAQYFTSELTSAGVRCDDGAAVSCGAPGSPPAHTSLAHSSLCFVPVDVPSKHVLDVSGAATVEVSWVAEDADDGAYDSGLRLADVYFSSQPHPGPIAPQDEFRMGREVDSDNLFADPINLDTGAFLHDEALLHVPGGGVPFAFGLHYDSTAPPVDRPVGLGWRHTYQWSLEALAMPEGGERVRVRRGDGGSDYFVPGDAGYVPESEGTYSFLEHRVGEEGEDGGWRYTTKERLAYHFDPNGALTAIRDRNGNGLTFFYSDGILYSIRDGRDQEAQLAYGDDGRLAQVDYAGLLAVELVYEGGQLVSVIRPDDTLHSFTYDDQGRLLTVVDALGTTVAFNHYDSHGRVAAQDDALENASEVAYEGDVAYTTDREGAVQAKTFEASAGRIVRWENAAGGVWTFAYDDAHELVEETDAFGGVTRYAYDERGNMTARLNALGAPSRVDYDAFDQMVAGQDPLGHVTRFEYDPRGNLVARTDPLGNQDRYAYDRQGRLVSWLDAKGHETLYHYNEAGDVTAVVDPLDATQAYDYDELGRQVARTNELGHSTQYFYDAQGRLLHTLGPLGREMAYAYDAEGRVVLERAPGGAETHFEYGPTGHLAKRTDALGNALAYAYDGEERLTTVTDPLGRTTTLDYDEAGRLTSVLDAADGKATSEYDVAGRRTAVTDANGNRTIFEHDLLGQLVGRTDALRHTRTNEFDLAGRLVARTNARGQRAGFEYDDADRLVVAHLPSGSVEYVYDANGNAVITARRPELIERGFDALNRLVRRRDSNGWAVGYAYDAAGNLTTLTYPDGDQVHYAYDALGRLVEVTDWLRRKTVYHYDAAGDLVRADLPDGSRVVFTYDLAGRLIGVHDHDAARRTLYRTAFELDGTGNIVRERTALPLGGLPRPGARTFRYGAANQLLTVDGNGFTYDADGNLEYGVLGGDVRRFLHDELGRLLRAGNDRYTYDADGYRIGSEIDGVQRTYVVDTASSPPRILEERDGRGKLVARYVHGLGLIGRDSRLEGYRTYHFDTRGSTLALTNELGRVTDRYAYGPFGELVAHEGETPNPFRYVGREGVLDDGNGLVFMQARYYAPELKRFLERDAAFLGALSDTQSLNGYAYAGNNPIVRVDPEGEFWNAVIGAAVGAVVNVAVQATVDAINGEFSGWDDYAGAAVEGAIGGAFIGSGAGLAGFLLAAGGQGAAVLGGRATQQLVAGEGLDFSSGELWAEVGFAAGTGGLGNVGGKGKKFWKARKAKGLQEAGNAKGLGKLLGNDAMEGFQSLYSPLKRGNLGRLMRSPAVRQSIRDQLVLDYAKGIFGERDKVHVLQYMN